MPSLSEKQAEAYLTARDALRRIGRISSLFVVPPHAGAGLFHAPPGRDEAVVTVDIRPHERA